MVNKYYILTIVRLNLAWQVKIYCKYKGYQTVHPPSVDFERAFDMRTSRDRILLKLTKARTFYELIVLITLIIQEDGITT